jgi:hypothetical protein
MGYVRKGAATKGASESLLTPKKPAIFAKSKSAANSRSDDSSSKQPSFKRFGRSGNSTATPPITPDGSPLNGVTVITTKTSPPSSPPREGDSAAGSIISDLSASIVRRPPPPPKFRIADEQESAVSGPPKTPEKARNLSESCSAGDYKEATEAIYKSLFGLVEDACQQVMPTTGMPASEHGDVNTSMDTEPVSNKKKEARFIVPTWGVPPTHSDDEDSDDDDSLFQSLATKKIPVANSRDESPKERGETHENFELVLDPDAMQQKEQKDKKRWWGKRNGKDQGEKQDMDCSSVIGPDTRKKTTAFVEPETLAHRSKYALGDLLVDDDNSLSMLNGEDLLGDEVVPDEEELPKEVTSKAVAAAAVTTAAVVVGTTAKLPKSSHTKTSTPPASPSRSALAIVNEATPPTPSPVEPSTPLPSVPEATVAAVPAEARSTQRVQSAPDAEKNSSASSFMSLSNPFAGLVRIGSGGKDKKIAVAAPPAPPKPIWKEAVDPITGRAYYYHRLTRKTTWTKPGEEEAGVEVTKRQFGTSVRKGGRAHMEVPLEIKKIGSLRDQFDEIARVADVSAEKQRKIEDGDYTSEKKEGILKKKFTQKDYSPEVWAKKKEIQRLLTKISPPDAESVVNVIQQYDGREDELMDQLRDMADSSPFDEPIPTAQSYCSSEKSEDEGKYLNEMEEDCEPIVSSSRSLPVKQPVVISSTKPLSQPALEGPALEAPTSPSHLSRIRTSQSNVTGISTWTERTEQTAKAGNLMGTNVFETIAEEIRPADTSLSSNEDSYEESYLPSSARISRVTPRVSAQASRTRELRVEEFSSSRLGLRKERFNKKPSYSPPRSRKTRFEGSVRGPSPASMTSTYNEDREETETDTNASDSVSALSHSDAEFISRKEKFDKARRKVLESAISKKDWQTAAEVTDDFILYRGSAGSGSGGSAEYESIDTAFAEEWTQSEVDKFISENDWDAVAKYIAYMRDINASASKIPPRPPPNSTSKQQVPMQGYPVTQTKSVTSLSSSASSTNSAYHRKFGARSQLQHETLQSVSSWESEESEFSEYSSGSYDDALDIEPRSNRNFAC